MGFYFRKSIKMGALRINFSKSGVGFSTGVKGLRIGTNARGNYVYIGGKRTYYKKTGSSNNKDSLETSEKVNSKDYDFEDLSGKKIEKLVDSSHEKLLDEINSKNKKINLSIVYSISIFLLGLFNYYLFFLYLFLPLVSYYNKLRKTVVLIYDIEEDEVSRFQKFYDSFNKIINANKKWYIFSKANLERMHDRKVNAGAGELIKRESITIKKDSPKYFKTNVEVPLIITKNRRLYFFPDKLLVYEGKKVGAVNYKDLDVFYDNQRFIEEECNPKDATKVGETWKYVNKNGSRDKRFKNNKILPIYNYSQLQFSSKNGFNFIINISRENIGREIYSQISKIVS